MLNQEVFLNIFVSVKPYCVRMEGFKVCTIKFLLEFFESQIFKLVNQFVS